MIETSKEATVKMLKWAASDRRTRRPARRTSAALLGALLAMGLVGCGSDSENSTANRSSRPPSTRPEAVPTSEMDSATLRPSPLCQHWAAIDDAAGTLSDPDVDPGQATTSASTISTALEQATQAPDDIAGDIDAFRSGIEQLIAGDPTALESDEVNDAYQHLGAWVHDNCGFTQIDITYANHTFDGMPDTLESGPTSIQATNTDAEAHVALFFKIHDDQVANLDDLIQQAQASDDVFGTLGGTADDVAGGAYAAPGETSTLALDLAPGTYLVLCPIPAGYTGDGPPPNAPSHFASGMYSIVQVT